MPFTVAIVGRPNVGKSTLFNRLVGRKLALVDNEPGVTRDRREGDATLFGLAFMVVDTAGLEEAFDDSLEARMRRQTEIAVRDADLVLLLIDAVSGLLPLDQHFARWLRRCQTPVALVANKCESRRSETGLGEAYGLGLGEPIPISAEHGVGMTDLARVIAEAMDKTGFVGEAGPEEDDRPEAVAGNAAQDGVEDGAGIDEPPEEDSGPLQLAIVGRPNVGKSTLINRLLDEDRLLTGPEAGITRDSIAVEWDYKGSPVKLIDTAGLRRRARVSEKLERLSVGDSRRSIDFAHVVVLLLDAENPLEKQDLTIARQVVNEGRALVIAVNKWDVCTDRPAAMQALLDRVQRSLPQVRGVPVITLSALQDRGFDKLMDAVLAAYAVWNKRISTARLNRWLESATASHPPPAVNGRRIRLKYMTQAKARPPTFALFCSLAGDLPTSYLRYLENGLRDSFGLSGTPIRLTVRKADNPYASRRRRS